MSKQAVKDGKNRSAQRVSSKRLLSREEMTTAAEELCMDHRQPYVPVGQSPFYCGEKTRHDLQQLSKYRDSYIAEREQLHPQPAQLFDDRFMRFADWGTRHVVRGMASVPDETLIAITARQEWEMLLLPFERAVAARRGSVCYVHLD
jgi:hypothetical protein